jgi:DNA-binding transcriptional LysR family regulator
MEELRSFLVDLDDEAKLRRGRVTVGASATISPEFVGGVISAFRARQPLVQIGLFDDGHAVERLVRRDIDVAIIPADPCDDEVSFEGILRDPFILAVPNGHAFASRRSVSFRDLENQSFVAHPPDGPAWKSLEPSAPRARSETIAPVQTRNPFAVLAMVRAGLGVGLIPRMLTEILNLDGVSLVSLDQEGLDREIGIAVLKGRAQSPAVAAFVDVVRQTAMKRQADYAEQSAAGSDRARDASREHSS